MTCVSYYILPVCINIYRYVRKRNEVTLSISVSCLVSFLLRRVHAFLFFSHLISFFFVFKVNELFTISVNRQKQSHVIIGDWNFQIIYHVRNVLIKTLSMINTRHLNIGTNVDVFLINANW